MNNSKLNETTNEKQKANQTVCIDKIIDPLFIKRAGEKSIASQKRNDVMPNNISNELYLECYCDEQWFSYEMVNLGEDAESIYAIVGAISYETILNNRGIDNKTIDDCNLTLNGEGPITWGKDFNGTYDIYSFETRAYIGTFSPNNNKFLIPIKLLQDTCGSCNFIMLPSEGVNGGVIFNHFNYEIEIETKDFCDTTAFSSEPDFQQNYFEGEAENAGSYSVNT